MAPVYVSDPARLGVISMCRMSRSLAFAKFTGLQHILDT